ncbi:hypothetical protein [Bacillus cereus]|uniref:hypothetical protein n=1 Tax=Bacillus cereus TaxID=1396 RepID=UPI000BEB39DF|nr:hypothetical protein [Bacillus cereus]HDR3309718.1 hypothetical protein [Bacillus thuringiensis]MDA2019423.1 hypothetical protein [Bacillus cereus]PDY18205.1 hypothetical protein COM76_14950 [Bacillus cereus]PFT89535.1 hypothetical protein COK66_20330 [Bacillus cereus]HDR3314583.1 hypothetical protein [Bacillus thuringiensis]
MGISYHDERHMYHMKAYLIDKLGWERREEIEAWGITETFEMFRYVYHGGLDKKTAAKQRELAQKAIWRR